MRILRENGYAPTEASIAADVEGMVGSGPERETPGRIYWAGEWFYEKNGHVTRLDVACDMDKSAVYFEGGLP